MTIFPGMPFLLSTWTITFFTALSSATTTTATSSSSSSSSSIRTNAHTKDKILSIPLIPHHVQRERRERELREQHRDLSDTDNNMIISPDAKMTQVASLYQGYGTHYADLWCGTPPQRQTVIVDTGSGVTAFPCTGCNDCGVPDYHINPLYDTSMSSTFHQLGCNECVRGSCDGGNTCKIGMSYQEGSSWYAAEVKDTCYVGGMHDVAVTLDEAQNRDDLNPFDAASFAFPLDFGCENKVTGLFKTQLADGIMGMDNAKASFWSQMVDHLGIKEQFSLCFSRSPIASRMGTNAGAMTLGGYDERFQTTPMIYTDVGQGGGFYGVTIRNMYLKKSDHLPDTKENLKSLFSADSKGHLKGVHAIVDSGTTDTYFERSVQNAFNAAWKEMVGSSYGHGNVKLTDEQLDSMPTVVFQVAGNVALNQRLADLTTGGDVEGLVGAGIDPENPYDVLIHMPSHHYMEYNAKDESYSARLYVDESIGGSVLGANFMMGHNIFFDTTQHIIGWAQSDCDYNAMVQPFLDSGDLVPNEKSSEEKRQQHNQDANTGTFGGNTANSGNHNTAEPPVDGTLTPKSSVSNACVSASCRFTALIIAGSVLTVLILAVVLVRRRRSRGRYIATAASELELQTGPRILSSASNDSDDGFGDVQYRDHVNQSRSSDDDDDDEEGATTRKGAYLADPEGDGEQHTRGVLS